MKDLLLSPSEAPTRAQSSRAIAPLFIIHGMEAQWKVLNEEKELRVRGFERTVGCPITFVTKVESCVVLKSLKIRKITVRLDGFNGNKKQE